MSKSMPKTNVRNVFRAGLVYACAGPEDYIKLARAKLPGAPKLEILEQCYREIISDITAVVDNYHSCGRFTVTYRQYRSAVEHGFKLLKIISLDTISKFDENGDH